MAYALHFAPAQRVLLVVAGAELTESIYKDCYRATARFVAEHGAVSGILDLSAVERFELSIAYLYEIGEMEPAFPVGTFRYVVASQPFVYGSMRIVHTLRSMTEAPIDLVRTIDDAFVPLHVTRADFAPISAE